MKELLAPSCIGGSLAVEGLGFFLPLVLHQVFVAQIEYLITLFSIVREGSSIGQLVIKSPEMLNNFA